LTSFPLSGILLSTVALVGGLTREREREMTKLQKRMERFAELRAVSPEADYEEIMMKIHDEELEDEETNHYAMLESVEREREELYCE
jgi:hypothetical protein